MLGPQRIWQFVVLLFFFNISPALVAGETSPFPVRIEHAFGFTVIEAKPNRIVTIDWSADDVVLALGEMPVGMTKYGFFEDGISPWNHERLGDVSPVLLSGELDYELISTLNPDVILATFSGIDSLAYKRLAQIAPTIAYRSRPWSSSWEEQTMLISMALGKEKDGASLVSSTKSYIRAYRDKAPALQGLSFTFGTYLPGGNGVVVYLESDPRVKVLTEMGLNPSPGVVALGTQYPDILSISVPFEKIDMIDADILIMWYYPGARKMLEENSLFRLLEVHQRGGYIPLEDGASIWATSAPSVLSIPYAYPSIIEKILSSLGQQEQQ